MRGIGEIVEVIKSGPPTPSTVSVQSSVAAKINGMAPPLTLPPPPQPEQPLSTGDASNRAANNKSDIIAAPPSFDDVVTPTENRLSSNEDYQPPVEKPHGRGHGHFTKMRSLLEIQLAGGTVDLPDGEGESAPNGVQGMLKHVCVFLHSHAGVNGSADY